MKAILKSTSKVVPVRSIPLNLQPHAEKPHVLTFAVKRFPTKWPVIYLQCLHPDEEIRNLRGTLRVISKVQGVDVTFSIRYETVSSVSKNQTVVTSRSVVLPVLHHASATREEREEVLALCAPYLDALDAASAERVRLWALPSLEEVAAMLTEEQRKRAALLLYREFVA